MAAQETASTPVPATRVTKALAWGCAVAVTSLVTWWRLPATTRQTVWAEDGGVFLRDVLSNGHLRSIPLPYDGYLHVVPRILASIAHAAVPLDGYAVATSFLSCLVVALVSVGVFHLSRSLTGSVPVRLVLAAIPVLLPVGPQEVLGNAANLHWYLLWLAPWLLLYRPKSRLGSAAMFTVALATATSEIITGMFLPLAVWAAVKRRHFAAPAGLLLGVCLQVFTALTKPRFSGASPTDAADPWSVVLGFGLLPIGSIWHADSRTLASNIVMFGAWSLVIPALLLLGLLAYTLITGRSGLKIAAAGAFAASALCWTASVVLSGNTMFTYAMYTEADWATGFGYIRYAAAPAMFLLVLLPLALAAAQERGHIGRGTATAVAGMFVAFLLVSYFPATTVRQLGPEWAAGVGAARSACENDPNLTAAPASTAPAAWKFAQVQIPCQELRTR